MAPEEDRFHSYNTRKYNFIGKKKPQEFVWKFIEKHMKIHETKIRRPATKEDKYMFNSWKYMKLKYVDQLQKKTSICFFMIAKPLADR